MRFKVASSSRSSSLRVLPALALALASAWLLCLGPGCSGGYGEGVGCHEDSQCKSGLRCVQTYNYVSAGEGFDDCVEAGKACAQDCTEDSDCGEGEKCSKGCGPEAYCDRIPE